MVQSFHIVVNTLQSLERRVKTITSISFFLKFLIKPSVFSRHSIAFICQLLKFLLTIINVSLWFNEIQFVLFVQFFIFVSNEDQLPITLTKHRLKILDFRGHWHLNSFQFTLLLFLLYSHLVLVHLFKFTRLWLIPWFLLSSFFIRLTLKFFIFFWWVIVIECVGTCFFIYNALQIFYTYQ